MINNKIKEDYTIKNNPHTVKNKYKETFDFDNKNITTVNNPNDSNINKNTYFNNSNNVTKRTNFSSYQNKSKIINRKNLSKNDNKNFNASYDNFFSKISSKEKHSLKKNFSNKNSTEKNFKDKLNKINSTAIDTEEIKSSNKIKRKNSMGNIPIFKYISRKINPYDKINQIKLINDKYSEKIYYSNKNEMLKIFENRYTKLLLLNNFENKNKLNTYNNVNYKTQELKGNDLYIKNDINHQKDNFIVINENYDLYKNEIEYGNEKEFNSNNYHNKDTSDKYNSAGNNKHQENQMMLDCHNYNLNKDINNEINDNELSMEISDIRDNERDYINSRISQKKEKFNNDNFHNPLYTTSDERNTNIIESSNTPNCNLNKKYKSAAIKEYAINNAVIEEFYDKFKCDISYFNNSNIDSKNIDKYQVSTKDNIFEINNADLNNMKSTKDNFKINISEKKHDKNYENIDSDLKKTLSENASIINIDYKDIIKRINNKNNFLLKNQINTINFTTDTNYNFSKNNFLSFEKIPRDKYYDEHLTGKIKSNTSTNASNTFLNTLTTNESSGKIYILSDIEKIRNLILNRQNDITNLKEEKKALNYCYDLLIQEEKENMDKIQNSIDEVNHIENKIRKFKNYSNDLKQELNVLKSQMAILMKK